MRLVPSGLDENPVLPQCLDAGINAAVVTKKMMGAHDSRQIYGVRGVGRVR